MLQIGMELLSVSNFRKIINDVVKVYTSKTSF
jgi:hypothetical protein